MQHLKSIEIQNFRAIAQATYDLFPATVVLGHNGLGKSSLLDGLSMVFGAGGDPTDIRNGAKQATLRITTTNGYVATKVLTPKKATLTVEDPQGGDLPAPATVLGTLLAKDALNNRDILQMISSSNQGQLSDFVLKRLPTQVKAEDINAVLGEDVATGPLNIPQVRALEAAKYKERTRVNTDSDEAKKQLKGLEDRVGPEDSTDWAKQRDEATAEVASIEAEIGSLQQELKAEGDQKIAAKREKVNAAIAELRSKITALEHAIRDEESALQTYEQKVSTAIAKQVAEESADLNDRKTAAVEKRERAKAAEEKKANDAGIRKMIPETEARLTSHVTRATELTGMIEGLRRLATEAIRNLGVPGLDIIEDGGDQVIVLDAGDSNGPVRIDRLNGQKKIAFAVDLLLRSQEAAGSQCRAVAIEGEGLVPSMLKSLADACAAREAQLIVAMPREGEALQVIPLAEFLERELVAA